MKVCGSLGTKWGKYLKHMRWISMSMSIAATHWCTNCASCMCGRAWVAKGKRRGCLRMWGEVYIVLWMEASEGEGVHEGAFEGGSDCLPVDADAGGGVEVAVDPAGHALVVLDVEERLLATAAHAEVAASVVEGGGGGAEGEAAAEFGGGCLLEGSQVAVVVDVRIRGVADEQLSCELALSVGGIEVLFRGADLAG